MKKRVAMAMGVLAAAASCAQPAPKIAASVVDVEMRGSHFLPAEVSVERGHRVTFRFTNRDKIVHDAFIGDEEAQEDHEKEMREARKDGHGGHGAGERNAITVEPGKTGQLSYESESAGETLIGCHQPGHYAAGMVMKVSVR